MSALLEVSGVSVSFDGFKAINKLSFEIGEAEMRAIIGPNGAGKTTFMDIITGKTRPDEGHVVWGAMSRSLLGMSEAQIARAGIGRKFQKPTVFEDQTVRENLSMALANNRGPLAVLLYRTTQEDRDRVAAGTGARGVARVAFCRFARLAAWSVSFQRLRSGRSVIRGRRTLGCLLYTSPSPRDL